MRQSAVSIKRTLCGWLLPSVWLLTTGLAGGAPPKPRARDLGLPFAGTPGPHNAITDVPGVEVGHTTLIAGSGARRPGQGPVRTGVTVIFPHGKASRARSLAAVVDLNGNGELTGSHWVTESGFLEGPIAITNTHSVGTVHAAVVAWGNRQFPPHLVFTEAFSLPVVGETYDGFLNDINGFHVRTEHVFAALDGAQGGPVAEGNVGGGTGMVCFEFKGGIGTSSRRVKLPSGLHTVGVLVQANFGRRGDFRVLGAPVGKEISSHELSGPGAEQAHGAPRRAGTDPGLVQAPQVASRFKDGSVIVVIGTDAPLLSHQLARLGRRASLGLGRLGTFSSQSSGDLFIAFGRAESVADAQGLSHYEALPNDHLDPLFSAVVEAVEESVVNALIAAETLVGADGNTAYALPHDRLREVLRRYRVLPAAAR